jgi:transcription termination factor NusB
LCKNAETAQQLFDEVLAHVEDVWETIEVYTQRNQMSICLLRYDVRAILRLHHL